MYEKIEESSFIEFFFFSEILLTLQQTQFSKAQSAFSYF